MLSSQITSFPFPNLVKALVNFGKHIECPLCKRVMVNPFTISECGHIFCHDCICASIQRQCVCPQIGCKMPILVRNLKRSPAYASIVSNLRKLEEALMTKNDFVVNSKRESLKEDDDHLNEPAIKNKRVKVSSLGHSSRKSSISSTKPTLIIAFTSLDAEQKQMLATTYRSIDPDQIVILHEAPNVNRSLFSNVTHVLSRTSSLKSDPGIALAPRTMKYMMAILMHIPVIRYDWILECISAGCWVDHMSFLVDGDEVMGKATGTCAKSLSNPGQFLFEGMCFYITPLPLNAPSRQDLITLIEAGRGEVVRSSMLTRGSSEYSDKPVIVIVGSKDKDSISNSTNSIGISGNGGKSTPVTPVGATTRRRSVLTPPTPATSLSFLNLSSPGVSKRIILSINEFLMHISEYKRIE